MPSFAEQVKAGVTSIYINSWSQEDVNNEIKQLQDLNTADLLASPACKVQEVRFCVNCKPEDWINFLNSLSANTSISSFGFLRCKFQPQVWPHLFQLLASRTCLQRLSITRCLRTARAPDLKRAREVVQHIAVHCSQHLEDLSLGNMRLGKADADLPALIAACPKLQHLELELNRLSVSQLRRIDFAMATSSPELVVGVAQNLSPPITSRFRASFANLDVVYAGRRRREPETSFPDLMKQIDAQVRRTCDLEGAKTDVAQREFKKTGVSEEALSELEQRLGSGPLPPSLCEFLRYSDGWGRIGFEVPGVRPAARIAPFSVENEATVQIWVEIEEENAKGGKEEEEEEAEEEEEGKERLEDERDIWEEEETGGKAATDQPTRGGGYETEEEGGDWRSVGERRGRMEGEGRGVPDLSQEAHAPLQRAVQISDMEDSQVFLLIPPAPAPAPEAQAGAPPACAEAEWEAWDFSSWRPGAARYSSFRELLFATLRTLESLPSAAELEA